ncbi:hypothetical protein [Flavobacterium marginilacus]|uniref:hypothetical protein n=1 Tax=Flavobacterium marginilacus TaxID=3003256 RepID=UPI00248E8517|nr:hypothetical protein [Flavobacterium marginilacus]
MSKNNSPEKLSLFVLCLDQKLDLENIKKNFHFADDIILIGFDFKENFLSDNIKESFRFIDLNTNDKPILDFAKNDIVLLLDSDEEINEDLQDEILKITEKGFSNTVYSIEREFIFLNKKIKYGAVENNTEVRLFNRKFCSLKDDLPLIGKVIHKGKTKILSNKIQNLGYKDFDNYNRKQTTYNYIIAKMHFKKGYKTNAIKLLSSPFFSFIHQYFIKLGFLDKKEGYILAYIQSFGKLKSQILLWLLTNKINS